MTNRQSAIKFGICILGDQRMLPLLWWSFDCFIKGQSCKLSSKISLYQLLIDGLVQNVVRTLMVFRPSMLKKELYRWCHHEVHIFGLGEISLQLSARLQFNLILILMPQRMSLNGVGAPLTFHLLPSVFTYPVRYFSICYNWHKMFCRHVWFPDTEFFWVWCTFSPICLWVSTLTIYCAMSSLRHHTVKVAGLGHNDRHLWVRQESRF